jgi:hypothetical protein
MWSDFIRSRDLYIVNIAIFFEYETEVEIIIVLNATNSEDFLSSYFITYTSAL